MQMTGGIFLLLKCFGSFGMDSIIRTRTAIQCLLYSGFLPSYFIIYGRTCLPKIYLAVKWLFHMTKSSQMAQLVSNIHQNWRTNIYLSKLSIMPAFDQSQPAMPSLQGESHMTGLAKAVEIVFDLLQTLPVQVLQVQFKYA